MTNLSSYAIKCTAQYKYISAEEDKPRYYLRWVMPAGHISPLPLPPTFPPHPFSLYILPLLLELELVPFPRLCCPGPSMCAHPHTHTHAGTHARARARARALTHSLTHSLHQSLARAPARPPALTHARMHVLEEARNRAGLGSNPKPANGCRS